MKMYVPEEDPEKGTTELAIEVVVQLSVKNTKKKLICYLSMGQSRF